MSRLVAVGDVYGRLTVIEYHHTGNRYRKFWVCQCACGKTTITHSGSLRSGNTKSCGCLSKEATARYRKPENGAELTAVILGYKRHARNRGYPWNLTREQVRELISRPCHYCGVPPSNRKTTKNTVSPLTYSGIDRVDNTEAYNLSNVVPCCSVCNRAKGVLTVSEFFEWVNRIYALASQWG